MSEADSISEYLSRIRTAADTWDIEMPAARIVEVYFADISDDRIEELNELIEDGASEAIDQGMTQWRASNLFARFRKQVTTAESSDGQPIVVILELPTGQRFGEVFRRPVTTGDKFFRFCEALGVDVREVDSLDSDVLIGTPVPVTNSENGWQINYDRLYSR